MGVGGTGSIYAVALGVAHLEYQNTLIMADFLKAYALTREFEGGYVNDPADPGGETYKGIARRKQPRWQGWAIIDGLKKNADFPALLYKNTTLNAMVLDFYKHEFWDFLCCDSIQSQAVAYELFDTAVNMGRETAATFFATGIERCQQQRQTVC